MNTKNHARLSKFIYGTLIPFLIGVGSSFVHGIIRFAAMVKTLCVRFGPSLYRLLQGAAMLLGFLLAEIFILLAAGIVAAIGFALMSICGSILALGNDAIGLNPVDPETRRKARAVLEKWGGGPSGPVDLSVFGLYGILGGIFLMAFGALLR